MFVFGKSFQHIYTSKTCLVPSLACVTEMVTPGVGDLEVGGVVDLMREAVCTLVPGLCRLTVGCLTIGRAVMDLGPANADAAAIAPKTEIRQWSRRKTKRGKSI